MTPGAGWRCCCSPSSAMLLAAAAVPAGEPAGEEVVAAAAGGCAGAFGPSPAAVGPPAVALKWQGPLRLALPQGTAWGFWGARDRPAWVTASQQPDSPRRRVAFTPRVGRMWVPSGDPPAEPPGTGAVASAPLCCWHPLSASSAMGCSTEHREGTPGDPQLAEPAGIS